MSLNFNPKSLPQELHDLVIRNQFVPESEFTNGYCSKVYADKARVLKIPFQGEELTSGFRANFLLQKANGPKIIDSDPISGSLLMERFNPGTSLTLEWENLDDLEIFTRLAKNISLLPMTEALPIEQYFINLPKTLRPLLQELTTDSPSQFLHGDLHHDNILLDKGEWRPIDPKGLVGDPNYEAVAFLRNPIDIMPTHPQFEELTRDRLRRLEQIMGWSPSRMMAWFYLDRAEMVAEDPDGSRWTKILPTIKEIFNSLL